ncbi:hypothetical protein BH11PLA2_BH11PLA2_35620 [soil metagenome]
MRNWIIASAFALVGTAVVSAPTNGPTANPCYLTVNVPVGATLTVNGARTEQMTASRRFISPALPMDKKFYYTFVASYTSNGEVVSRKQQVEVTAGANLVVDMWSAEIIPVEKPLPVPKKNPFEAPKKK